MTIGTGPSDPPGPKESRHGNATIMRAMEGRETILDLGRTDAAEISALRRRFEALAQAATHPAIIDRNDPKRLAVDEAMKRTVTGSTIRRLAGGGTLRHVSGDLPGLGRRVQWRLIGHPHMQDMAVTEPVRPDGRNLPLDDPDRSDDACDETILLQYGTLLATAVPTPRRARTSAAKAELEPLHDAIAIMIARIAHDSAASPITGMNGDRVVIRHDSPFGPGSIRLHSENLTRFPLRAVHAPAWLDALPVIARMDCRSNGSMHGGHAEMLSIEIGEDQGSYVQIHGPMDTVGTMRLLSELPSLPVETRLTLMTVEEAKAMRRAMT
jgi:hypothetical protein